MMLMQSVIIVLCIPVLAGEICASFNFDSLLETLDIAQVNQQVAFLAPSMIQYKSLENHFNDNTSKGLPSGFSSYLSGLIEGDGHIGVPTQERSPKGKPYYAQVQIAFAIKDMPLAIYIKEVIGHGSISIKANRQSCIYTVNNIQGLIRLVTILNGHLRGGKIVALHNLIAYVNAKAGTSFDALPANTAPLTSSSWLTGFCDADASFQVRTTLNALYPRIGLSFELSQASFNNYGTSNLDILTPIGLLFGTNVLSIRQHRDHPQYRIMTGSLASMQLVRDYFEMYPLMSSKRLDFIDWCKIHDYIKQGTQLSNVEQIVAIKAGMNSKRTAFDWKHLSE